MSKKVAIVGAGPSGLAQLRAFQSAKAIGLDDTTDTTEIGLALGKLIPVKNVWYVNPSLGFIH